MTGIAIGDVIALINLATILIKSLRNVKNSNAQIELTTFLHNMKLVLEQLEKNPGYFDEVVELRGLLHSCTLNLQRIVDLFLQKVKHLRLPDGSTLWTKIIIFWRHTKVVVDPESFNNMKDKIMEQFNFIQLLISIDSR
jgi:hypothetical protein